MENEIMQRTVDVIIPTYHPDDKFERLLQMLSRQTKKPDRIIIMNTESSLFHSSLADTMQNVEIRHLSKKEFDHGGTRNQAAAISNADFLLFMTQDAVPADENLIACLLRAFSDEQVAAAYARQLADQKDNYLEWYTRQFNYPQESRKKTKADINTLGIKTFFCSNVCAMYRKTAYEEQGGFVLHAIFNEDMMMAADLIAAGYAVYYAADAKVWHWHNYSAWEQMRRNFDVAVSQQMAGGLFIRVKSESEGIRLVKSTCRQLLTHGKWYLIFKLVWQSGFKFIGYKLGQNYKKLPVGLIRRISLNPTFWKGNIT